MGSRFSSRQKGFTLAEMLVVLSMFSLFALILAPSLVRIRRSARQASLDARAELIFTLAQNQLILLRAGGSSIPQGLPNPYSNQELRWVDSGSNALFHFDAPSSVPRGYWILEYSPEHSSVSAVFYSETDDLSDYGGQRFLLLRDYAHRLAAGANIGYYGGEAISSSGTTQLHASIQILFKANTLTARLLCELPSGMGATDHIIFHVELYDGEGNSFTFQERSFSRGDALWSDDTGYFVWELILDNAEEGADHFSALFPMLCSGPLHLTLRASSSSLLYAADYAEADTVTLSGAPEH